MRVLIYVFARWCEVRSDRALAMHVRLKAKAEKYFRAIGLGADHGA